MSVTIRNADIKPAQQAIAELFPERPLLDTSYELRLLARELDAQAEIVDAMRIEIVKAHAPEGANELKPTDPGWDAFVAEYSELMAQTFDVQHTIKRSALNTRDKEGKRIPIEPPVGVVFGLGDLLNMDEA